MEQERPHPDPRHSVVSLPQTERTYGEGPSSGGHRESQQSVPNRGSLARSWIEQTQEGRAPPARWVQNKLFLHQSHTGGLNAAVFGDYGAAGPDDQARGSMGTPPETPGFEREILEDDFEDYEEEGDEQNEMNFFSPSLLSHVSVQLRDRVGRNSHIKGGIPWPNSFTGRDIVVSHPSAAPLEDVLKRSLGTDHNTILYARVYSYLFNRSTILAQCSSLLAKATPLCRGRLGRQGLD